MVGKPTRKGSFGHLGKNGRIILKLILKKWDSVNLINIRDQWRALVSTKMNLEVP
jgi:hypothetical protein